MKERPCIALYIVVGIFEMFNAKFSAFSVKDIAVFNICRYSTEVADNKLKQIRRM